MKKRLGMLLSTFVLAGMLCISASAATAYKAGDQYKGDVTQGPEWYYMVDKDGSGSFVEMNFCDIWGGDNWQQSTDPQGDDVYNSIAWKGGVCGYLSDSKAHVALAFKAPEDGTYAIGEWAHFAFTGEEGTDMVAKPINKGGAQILKNSEKIYPTGSDWATTYEGDKSAAMNVELKKGDMLYFVIKNDGNSHLQVSYANVQVQKTDSAAAPAPDGASENKNPSTGEASAVAVAGLVVVSGLTVLAVSKKRQ